MTLTRKLALALCLAFSFITPSSNSQTTSTSTTGNLINYGTSPTDTTSIWNNGVYVNQLGCFGGNSGTGYCGPNPNVQTSGNINFSYGQVNLNQIVNINTALAAAGTGLQLNGFNFGFMAKNGNGWDDGRQDYLSAYVKLNGTNGTTLATYDYTDQTNRRYNWSQFNFSETFATPYTASKLSTAQVGFVGRDNNFWAGPYGPEIYNVNFSLTYSVKPAAPPVVPAPPAYAPPAPAPAAPPPAEASPALAQASPQQQAQQPAPAPPPPQQDANQNPSVAQDNPAQPGPAPAGPPPTSPQPAGGPPQTATASASSSSAPSGGGSAGPSKLAMSVVRSAQANDRATQAQAVQNAAKAFEATQQSSQTASNAAVSMNQEMSANSATAAAQFSSQTTQASQQTSNQSGQGPQQSQQSTTQQQQASRSAQTTQQTQGTSQQQTFDSSVTSSVALRAPVITTVDAPVQSSSGTGLIVNRNPFAYNPLITNTNNTSTLPPTPPPVYQSRLQDRGVELDMPMVASFSGVGKAGNPLSELIMQQRFEMLQGNVEQQSSGVNRNVLPNELAGSIDLASMASIPVGFSAYSVVLKDAAFYEPKEVYKNQRTVDNVRVLRGLTGGSDALHQRMIDLQYK